MSAALVRALEQERERHARAGRTARVALVDDELAKLGQASHSPPVPLETAAASPPPETATEPRGGDMVCEECGAVAKSPAGLAAHRRAKHDPKAAAE